MTKSKTLHMETTSISVIKTCAEIEELLVKHNVTTVLKSFENNSVSGIQFILNQNGQHLPIKIPFRWQAIKKLAENGKTAYRKTADEEQSRRIAARLELRWLQAMFAKIDVGMADIMEIFMPYIMVNERQSFYEKIKENNFKGLLCKTNN